MNFQVGQSHWLNKLCKAYVYLFKVNEKSNENFTTHCMDIWLLKRQPSSEFDSMLIVLFIKNTQIGIEREIRVVWSYGVILLLEAKQIVPEFMIKS